MTHAFAQPLHQLLFFCKREHGPQHIGYETGHREAAVEYVNEVMSVWFSLNPPDIRGLDQLLPS